MLGNLFFSMSPADFITYFILVMFEMVVCVLAIIGANFAVKLVRKENDNNLMIGVVGGIVCELLWRMITSGKYPGYVDNMIVSLCAGLIAVLVGYVVRLVMNKKGKATI